MAPAARSGAPRSSSTPRTWTTLARTIASPCSSIPRRASPVEISPGPTPSLIRPLHLGNPLAQLGKDAHNSGFGGVLRQRVFRSEDVDRGIRANLDTDDQLSGRQLARLGAGFAVARGKHTQYQVAKGL